MLISVLSFPEIASIAELSRNANRGGLESLLMPEGWGDITTISELGNLVRSADGEQQEIVADNPIGVEGALAVLGAFFRDHAPAAFRVFSPTSPVRLRILASAEEVGVAVDVGSSRVAMAVLDRAELLTVAADLLGDAEGGGKLMVSSGRGNVFPAEFDSGESLVEILSCRPRIGAILSR